MSRGSGIPLNSTKFLGCDITNSKIEPLGLPIKATWVLDRLLGKPDDYANLLCHARCIVDVPLGQLEFSISNIQNRISVQYNTLIKYPALFDFQLDLLDPTDYTVLENLMPITRVTISPGKRHELRKNLYFSEKSPKLALGITVQPFQCNVKSSSFVETPPSQQKSNLVNDIKRFCYTPNNYPDIQIETKDKMMLNGHKFILAARSQVLHDIIEERKFKMGLNNVSVITLRDVESKPLSIVLHWMYTDEILDVIVEEMEAVVNVAMTYGVAGIMGHIEKKLIEICDQDNMCRLLDLAKKNGLQKAVHYIAKYVGESLGLI